MRWLRRLLVLLVLMPVLGIGLLLLWLQTDTGHRQVGELLAWATRGSSAQIQIGAIEGRLPVDITLHDLRIADSQGDWFRGDRIHLTWSPLSLLGRQVKIDILEADTLTLLRAPGSSEPQPPSTEPPSLPHLPVTIDLEKLAIARVSLPKSLVGNDMAFTIQAKASAARSGDLTAQLSAQRLDQPDGTDDIALNAAYRQATDQLSLDFKIDEPRGGIVSELMGLHGNRHLAIQAKGDAPLSAWSGTVSAKLDDIALLDLQAALQGSNTDRQFKLSLTTDPSILVPATIRPIMAGGLRLESNGHVRQAGGAIQIQIDRLQLHGDALDLSAQGLVDPSGDSKLHIELARLSDSALAPFAPRLSWQGISLAGDVTGHLALPTIKLSAGATEIGYSGNRINQLTLSLDATPGATATAPINLTAKAVASGIDPAQANLKALAKSDLKLDIAGSADLQGTIDLPTIAVTSQAATINAQAQAQNWGKTAHAILAVNAGDLAAFRDITGLPLTGALKIDAEASRTDTGAVLELTAAADGFAAGQQQVDNLLGPSPRLALHVTQAGSGIDIQQAELSGRSTHIAVEGHANSDDIALDLTGNVPNLASVDRQLAGDLGLKVKVAGTAAQPRLDGELSASSLAIGDIKAGGIALTAQIRDLKALSGITAAGKATVNGLPATIKTAANITTKDGRKTVSIDDLQLQLSRTSVSAQAQIVNGLITGQAKLAAPDLAELKPMTGADLKGRLTATATLRTADGRQNVEALLTGNDLSYAETAQISRLQIDAKALDVFHAPNISTKVNLAEATVSKQKLTSALATFTGPLTNLAFAISGKGPRLDLDLAGTAAASQSENRVTLNRAKFKFQDQQISLVHPATVSMRGSSIDIANFVLANGPGQLALDGKLAPEGNRMNLQIQHLSLGLLTLVAPADHINGEINGSLQLSGSKSAPEADLRLSLDSVSSSDLSIPPTAAKFAANWRAGRLGATGEVKLTSQEQPLQLAASLPLPADASTGLPRLDSSAELAATVKGKIDLAIANGLFLDGVSHVGGQADIDVKAAGPLSKPNLSGRIALVDGSYGNQRMGTRLRAIQAMIVANGTHVELQRLDAKTPGNGVINGSGHIDLGDKRDISIHITANNAQLLDTDLASAVTDADLSITSLNSRDLQMAGEIKVDKAEIRIPDSIAGSVQEIDVTERNTEAKTSGTAPPVAKPQSSDAPPPMRIALDLRIDAPQQVAVRGRGLDAELGGKLHVGGDASQPAVTGRLNLRRGTLNLVGRNLTFDHGVISFDGGTPIDPQLDFSAKSKAEAYDITVAVSGTATKPSLAITSTPELPQDEALARLLFGRSAGSLTPLQALQLAQATAELAGVNTGPDVFDKLRRATGLDRLSFDAGQDAGSQTAATGPSLNAGRYVAPGVYLGVKQGAKAGSSAATVELDVTSHVKVETDIGAQDNSKAGINMQWDY
ncbi:MAG TPA: translocation/assembly module TamB domain-containing protein [Dongiaceae bacterium]|nr:translocation/assembly module TamB domain-containing protein [Dongiaceae bacterium]